VTADPPDVQDREAGPKNTRALFRSWFHTTAQRSAIALVAGLLLAGGVAVYLWTSDEGSDRPATAAPERGVACPGLREAFDQNQAGNDAAFRRAVDAAARAGVQALDRSGQVFGRPEEIALELQYALTEGPDRARKDGTLYLEQAGKACEQLGRWAEPG
jgi:hypothetical protein